jgi:hypothetical protein
MPAAVRMTDGQTDEVVAAVADALQSAELTGDELSDAVVERTGSWAADPVMPAFAGMWPRWRQALHTAGHRGALCFGADRGRKVTYTNPARFRPGFTPLTPGEALPRAVAHYLHAYGPATPQHFAQWLSTRPRWTADLFGRLAADGAIEQVEFGGVTAWVNAGDTAFPDSPPQGVMLLPYFDAYAVACQPRDLLFPGRAFERALGGGQAGNFPVLLIDGVVAGVWHQRRSGRNIDVTVEALNGLTAAQRLEVEVRAERVAEVLEGRLRLTVGPVSVGAHA